MSKEKENERPVDIVVNEVQEGDEEATLTNDGMHGAAGGNPVDHDNDGGDTRGAANGNVTGRATPRIGVKLKMPSGALQRLSTTYNQLRAMQKQEGVKGVVMKSIKEMEQNLEQVKVQWAQVNPVSEAQHSFKQEWYTKNVVPKEIYLQELKGTLNDSASGRNSCRSSKASSRSSRAIQEARAHEKILELRRKKLVLLQQEQERIERRRREEEDRQMKAMEEQLEIELQLEETRLHREALENEGSIIIDDLNQDHNDLGLPHRQTPVDDWLDAAEQSGVPPPVPTSNDPTAMQSHLLQHVLLAQAKLPIFKGDLMEFLWFWKSFEMQVECVTKDPARRLYLLLQQLEGEPHTLVKGCQLERDANRGYSKAKALLLERYGSPVSQSLAIRHQLMAWPMIRTAEEVKKFTVQLHLCQQLKDSQPQNRMSELDGASTLLKLVKKLPEKMQMSWQTKVVDVETNQCREVDFNDFVAFVARHDKARNHPVFGKLELYKPKEGKEQRTKALATAVTDDCLQLEEEAEAGSNASSLAINSEKRTLRQPAQDAQHNSEPNAFKPPCLICEDKYHCAAKCPSAKTIPKPERLAKLTGLCFGCLKPGHSARTCKSRLRCETCQGMHPTILHTPRPETDTEKKETQTATNLATDSSSGYAVATVPIRLWITKENYIIVKAILDPGSTATFITEDAVKALGANASTTSLRITTIRESQQETQVGVLHGLKVADYECNSVLDVNVAYVVEALPFNQHVGPAELEQWPHLQDVPFYWTEAPVAMLIGLNVRRALRPQAVVYGADEEPYAVKTALGWALQGPIGPSKGAQPSAITNFVRADEIANQLNRLYYKEFEDVFTFGVKGWSQDDFDWLRKIEASTERDADTGNYTVGLPFRRETKENLRNNRRQAEQRLCALSRKFKSNQQFKCDYVQFMDKMLESGFVERVTPTPDDDKSASNGTYYVLHHRVYHPHKPGKIRVVFNCASKFHGTALNDCLLSGPDLTNSIVGVLLRFRQNHIAFMADIDSMFYSVLVPEAQRDMLRFLWWPGGDESKTPATYRLRVHLFGATSSPSVANYVLRQSAEEAWRHGIISKQAKDAVYRNFYVDDCLKSAATIKEAVAMARDLEKACAYGGFRLSKFVSTSVELLKSIDQSKLAADLKSVDLSDDKTDPLGSLIKERALGVAWNVKRDCFVMTVAEDKNSRVTKRSVLSKLSQVYDPLGMAAPVIITARLFFRKLTQKQQDWDQELNEEEIKEWNEWRQNLQDLLQVEIPRCYASQKTQKGAGTQSWQLHAFCDASLEAYCVALYLREELPEGEGSKNSEYKAQVAFVYGKARVSPPKLVTVPRLELVAAKLAADAINMVQRELEVKITRRTIWTDSTTVLKYLHNRNKRFDTFVTNRVQAILSVTEVNEWRYVPTKQNAADIGSRGIQARHLNDIAWLKGPAFLQENEEQWPRPPADQEETAVVAVVHQQEEEPAESVLSELLHRYSNLHKLNRHASIWMRYRSFLRSSKDNVAKGPITLDELRHAEQSLIRWAQEEAYWKEIGIIKAGNNIPRKSPIFKLAPTVDKNTRLLMIGSRVRMPLPILPTAGSPSSLQNRPTSTRLT